ncbi:MAG TPA: chemotaxis protein CheX [Planctomycetota bacterium]|nr:chemotaxis protein CheX [Planctomycetota bacterium]
MKIEHINPFIVGMTSVFEEKVGVKPRKSNLGLKTGYQPSHDVSAVIGLSGNAFGSVVLSFPREAAQKIVFKMLGTEEMSDDSLADGIGDLANMVAGSAKAILADSGVRTFISIPRVVLGQAHYIYRPREVPCVEIAFDTDLGAVTLEICLKVLQETPTPAASKTVG